MQIKLPEPFFFEEGNRAVLLLHGFTGNSSDVRQLGRYLQRKGYTSYAPQYEGHAAPPEEILSSSPFVWFKDALDGYDYIKTEGSMFNGVLEYARNFKKYEGKDEATIEKEMTNFKPTDTLKELQGQIQDVRDHIDEVMDPLLVVQAEQDQMINTDSANVIYNESESDEKDIKWYANSGHVITIGKEKELVFEDVYNFLESLDWSN